MCICISLVYIRLHVQIQTIQRKTLITHTHIHTYIHKRAPERTCTHTHGQEREYRGKREEDQRREMDALRGEISGKVTALAAEQRALDLLNAERDVRHQSEAQAKVCCLDA